MLCNSIQSYDDLKVLHSLLIICGECTIITKGIIYNQLFFYRILISYIYCTMYTMMSTLYTQCMLYSVYPALYIYIGIINKSNIFVRNIII